MVFASRLLAIPVLLLGACAPTRGVQARAVAPSEADRIVQGALRQAREGAAYTTGYVRLGYPGGDLPRDRGVCTDVVVRALRDAGHHVTTLVRRAPRSASEFRWSPGTRPLDPATLDG